MLSNWVLVMAKLATFVSDPSLLFPCFIYIPVSPIHAGWGSSSLFFPPGSHTRGSSLSYYPTWPLSLSSVPFYRSFCGTVSTVFSYSFSVLPWGKLYNIITYIISAATYILYVDLSVGGVL